MDPVYSNVKWKKGTVLPKETKIKMSSAHKHKKQREAYKREWAEKMKFAQAAAKGGELEGHND